MKTLVWIAALAACSPTPHDGDDGTTPDGSIATHDAAVHTDGGTAATGIKTVFLIMMENESWADIKGNSSAPYLNHTLLAMGAHAEAYKGPSGGNLHPSEPNYIWLEAGDSLGITNDDDPTANHRAVTDHLVTLMANAQVEWRSYQEDITGSVCPLTSVGNYKPKHNPMVFFDDVIGYANGHADANAPNCMTHVRPLGELVGDLETGHAGRYNLITPNQCNDMHTSCAPQNNPIKQGDDWLSTWIPRLLASPAYTDGGAIFITWDEAEGGTLNCLLGNCPIGMIVLSPFAKQNYQDSTAYDHSSTLKTMQEIFHLTPLLRHAADSSVTDLRDLFVSFP